MRFLVIGCGSAGERHTKNLLSLGQEVFVLDKDRDKARTLVKKYGAQIWEYDILSTEVDAFIICTPPVYHIQYAKMAVVTNAHTFVEKPFSHSLIGIDETMDVARQKNLIIQVGYQFRFHPGLRLAKKLLDEGRIGKLLSIQATFGQYLSDWHPNEDYRNLYTAHKEQGGGIILDASHEIDYTRWLAGSEISKVSCFAGKLSSLDVDVEDTADILLTCANNTFINLHLDFTQRTYTRWCKMIGETGTIKWNYNHRTLFLLDGKEHNLMYNTNDMYLEELKHFISCIENKEKPIVDGGTGKRVLEIALAAKQSARENRVVEL